MNNIDDILQHHGVKGMKWGVRRFQPYPKGSGKIGKEVGKAKRVSNRELRKERSRISDKEEKAIVKKYETTLNNDIKKAIDFGKKHNLDLDDGGGGDPKRGREYMKLWDDIQNRQVNITSELSRNTSEKLVAKYGKERIDKLDRSDNMRGMLAVAGFLAIPLATATLAIVADTKR